MRSIILSLIAAVGVSTAATAQTDFRHISFDEGCQAAMAEGKQLFVDFYTDWCGPCKRMASNVFPQKKVGDYFNANFVCLKIDAEKGEGPELAKRYGVHAYPTFVVIDPSTRQAVGDFAGGKEADDFIAKVETIRNPELSPEKVTARYEGGDRTPLIVAAYAGNIVDGNRDYREGVRRAGVVMDEYFARLSDAERLDPVNHFMYASFRPDYTTPRAKFLIANRDKFGPEMAETIDGVVNSESIRYFLSDAVCQEGGRESLQAFTALVKELGKDKELGRRLEFVAQRGRLTPEKYLEYVAKNFDKLTDEDKTVFTSQLSGALDCSTPERAKKAAAWCRTVIGSLPTGALTWAAYSIDGLEREKKH